MEAEGRGKAREATQREAKRLLAASLTYARMKKEKEIVIRRVGNSEELREQYGLGVSSSDLAGNS